MDKATREYHEQAIADATAVLEQTANTPDDPRRMQALQLRAESRIALERDAARADYADLKDEELHERKRGYDSKSGELAILAEEMRDALKRFPPRASLNGGTGTQEDARFTEARERYEAAQREAFRVNAELEARDEAESHERYKDERVEAALRQYEDVENASLAERERLAYDAGLIEDAAQLRELRETPAHERAWAASVAERAEAEAQQELSALRVRDVGGIPGDNKAMQAIWDEDKVVKP